MHGWVGEWEGDFHKVVPVCAFPWLNTVLRCCCSRQAGRDLGSAGEGERGAGFDHGQACTQGERAESTYCGDDRGGFSSKRHGSSISGTTPGLTFMFLSSS